MNNYNTQTNQMNQMNQMNQIGQVPANLLHEIARSNQLLQQTQAMQHTTGTPIRQQPQQQPQPSQLSQPPVADPLEIELSDVNLENIKEQIPQSQQNQQIEQNPPNQQFEKNQQTLPNQQISQNERNKYDQSKMGTVVPSKPDVNVTKDIKRDIMKLAIRPILLLVIIIAFLHPSTAKYINQYVPSDSSIKSVITKSAIIVGIYTSASIGLNYYGY